MTCLLVTVGIVIALALLAVAVWGPRRLGRAWRALGDAEPPAPARAAAEPAPARSDALALLAVLQQEARLIDFLKESLDGYSDAQIGAAVRDVHRDAAAVVERLFAVRPLRQEPEGAAVEVRPGFDAASLRLTGQVAGAPPYRGTLRHPGWEATKCELPRWVGHPAGARVIGPAEVEIR